MNVWHAEHTCATSHIDDSHKTQCSQMDRMVVCASARLATLRITLVQEIRTKGVNDSSSMGDSGIIPYAEHQAPDKLHICSPSV